MSEPSLSDLVVGSTAYRVALSRVDATVFTDLGLPALIDDVDRLIKLKPGSTDLVNIRQSLVAALDTLKYAHSLPAWMKPPGGSIRTAWGIAITQAVAQAVGAAETLRNWVGQQIQPEGLPVAGGGTK